MSNSCYTAEDYIVCVVLTDDIVTSHGRQHEQTTNVRVYTERDAKVFSR